MNCYAYYRRLVHYRHHRRHGIPALAAWRMAND